jgi:hypothetical protein
MTRVTEVSRVKNGDKETGVTDMTARLGLTWADEADRGGGGQRG